PLKKISPAAYKTDEGRSLFLFAFLVELRVLRDVRRQLNDHCTVNASLKNSLAPAVCPGIPHVEERVI
ncbi:hypothetical protein, partial [Cloacibacillus evryensis]|uniref:hypothetical protein n=1 Tax=Cloacibacillus evryensis TaxID=508460 RepID=UPI003AB8CF09